MEVATVISECAAQIHPAQPDLAASWEVLCEVFALRYVEDADDLAEIGSFLGGASGRISMGVDEYDLELRDDDVIITLHDREARCDAAALAKLVAQLERAVRDRASQ